MVVQYIYTLLQDLFLKLKTKSLFSIFKLLCFSLIYYLIPDTFSLLIKFSKIRPDLGLPWWLGLRFFSSTAGGLASSPDQGTKILHALRPEKKIRPDCKRTITTFPQSNPTSQVGFFSSVINLSSHLLFITPNKMRIYSLIWGLFLLFSLVMMV